MISVAQGIPKRKTTSASGAAQPDQETINGNRRGDTRYGLRLDVQWRLIRRRRLLDEGVGKTLDISAGGILFDCGRALPVGFKIDLRIKWPVLLNHVTPLQLVVSGRIVRTDGSRAAIRMSKHEFRTTAVPSADRPFCVPPGAPCYTHDPYRGSRVDSSISA